MSPDGLRGGGAGDEVGVWSVVEDRHPLDPPHHHGMEGVRSPEAELAQHGDAHSSIRRRKMLRPARLVRARRNKLLQNQRPPSFITSLRTAILTILRKLF